MDEKVMRGISDYVDSIAPELKKLSHDIHENPELGDHEFKALEWQTALLKKHGFEVETQFCDIPTSYKAVYKGSKPGPKIAFLAEYDALPGIGHACGHNLINMMSIGGGLASKAIVDEFGGEIHVIGTPAEETKGSKVEMSRKGAFKGYDVAMMCHPAIYDNVAQDTAAILCRRVEFFGKTAHAAGKPWEGINALDAMINFFNMANAQRQQMLDPARFHAIITDGGEAPNIIPEYTAANFYVRSPRTVDAEALLKKIEGCIQGAALGAGCTYKISEIEVDFKDSVTNRTLGNLFCDQYEKLGHTIDREITRSSGSSDEGDVSYECPAIQTRAGLGLYDDGREYGPHTREFAVLTGREANMDHCLEFSKAFAMCVYEMLTDPQVLKDIKAEFDKIER